MRNETQMMELILGVAQSDERIRAVYMNGSRTNPNVPKDIYQDYDIVYVVNETLSFLEKREWISVFGNLLMIQEPDNLDKQIGMAVDFSQSYSYLMLFDDGNRIDLHIATKEYSLINYTKDSLTMPLLDKDHILPKIPKANDSDYWAKRPTQALFNSQGNNFWWCLQNIAKGIKRDELPYTKNMFDNVVRDNLNHIVSWWIGMNHDFKVSTGKNGKYFKNYLPSKYWNMYQNTYSDSNEHHIWNSLFTACQLFHILATDIAEKLDYKYNIQDEKNMLKYLRQVKELPKHTKEIFPS